MSELFNGTAIRNFKPKEAQAFCEGMAHRQSDTGANAPITDNPHSADSQGGLKDAWDAGWTEAEALSGGNLTVVNNRCCNIVGAVQV